MIYRLLADAVVAVHLAFVAFVVFGGLLALRFRRAPWVHVPAALWGAYIEIAGGTCPLTPLENRLRHAAGAGEYGGGFVERYLLPVLYPSGLTHDVQLALGVLVVVFNLAVYAGVLTVWRARRRKKRGESDTRRHDDRT